MHYTIQRFWKCYGILPEEVRQLADRQYELLKLDPSHPSLHFKKVGQYWSVRVGRGYRALGIEVKDGVLWVWIGTHKEYDRMLK
jgi:hypothetical protein